MKTKVISHGDKIKDCYNKEISKVNSNHTCVAVISLDFALKKDESYYPQVLLKNCKYIDKNIIKQLDNLSEFSSDNESDEE